MTRRLKHRWLKIHSDVQREHAAYAALHGEVAKLEAEQTDLEDRVDTHIRVLADHRHSVHPSVLEEYHELVEESRERLDTVETRLGSLRSRKDGVEKSMARKLEFARRTKDETATELKNERAERQRLMDAESSAPVHGTDD